MTMDTSRALEEARIRTAIDDRTRALRTAHIAGALSCHAMDVLPGEGRAGGSSALVAQDLEGWLSAFRGPAGCEVHELSITADDDVAFGHGLLRISGSKADGGEIDVWTPATFRLRKIDGTWTVTNEHTPVPACMRGGARAAARPSQLCA